VAILQLGEAHIADARAPGHFPLTQALRPAVFHDPGTEGAPFFPRELTGLFGSHSAFSSDDSESSADFSSDVKNFRRKIFSDVRVAGQ